MKTKVRAPFLQRVATTYPWMLFLSRARSEENQNKLSNLMDNLDEDVAKLFMEFLETDLREDPELFCLINAYFTTSKAVSKLCESLKKYLERLERDECHEALLDVEEEKLGYGGNSDLGCDDILRKIQRCHKELTTLIVKLEKRMNEFEKKLKRVRGPRGIIAAFTTCGTLSRKKSTEDLGREKTAMTSMKTGTMVALIKVEKIRRLVSRYDSMWRSEFVGGLDRETGSCDGVVQFGRKVAHEKIVEFLSRG